MKYLSVLVVFGFVAGVCFSQSSSPTHKTIKYLGPCQKAVTQADLNICFSKEAQRADVKLKATYEHYLAVLGEPNKQRLVVAQQAWLQYRTAECVVVAGVYDGGSMEQMQHAACIASLSDARTKELKTDYIDLE